MKVTFRHGIVRYQQPEFLVVSGSIVSLLATTPLVATIAFGSHDYLHIEHTDIYGAWTDIVPNVDQWLYIDIDRRTGARTFGVTSPIPIIGPNEPINPAQDQHWFDTNLNMMKVWDTTLWFPKIRIIVCRLEDGSIPQSVSDNLVDFAGTQINDYTNIFSGLILYDLSGYPIKNEGGDPVTSEDTLFTTSSAISPIKFDSVIFQAVAETNIPKYSIVKLIDYGIIRPADIYTASSLTNFGIIMDDVAQGAVADITVQGLVSTSDWDWSIYPVNTLLYVNNTGVLTTTPIFPEQTPVASIVDISTIKVGVPSQWSVPTNIPLMSTTVQGIARLNIPADIAGDPVVVGANDPRLTDARQPTPHIHPISDVTNLQTNLDAKVNLSGGTMTGQLLLPPPMTPSSAVTRQYVNDLTLDALADVVVTSPAVDSILSFNGTYWVDTTTPGFTLTLQGDVIASGSTLSPVNTTLVAVVSPGTYTKVTVDNKGRTVVGANLTAADVPGISWNHIVSDKPTTLSGYGITNAYTKFEVDNHTWNWSAITGTPTSLAGYGITDAYTKFEVDNHVWNWSAITNTPSTLIGYGITDAYTKFEVDNHTWNWSAITNTPSTLSGYGILDAYTKLEVDNHTWNWSAITNTPSTLSGYGIGDAVANASGTPSIAQNALVNRPTGTTGQLFVDTTNNKIQRYDGVDWIDVSGTNFAPLDNPIFTGTVSAPSMLLNNETNITTAILTTSSLVPAVVEQFSVTTYRSAEYLVQITNGTNYQLTKILVIHDNNTVFTTEYGTVKTGPVLGTFDAVISVGYVLFQFTPAFPTSTTVKSLRFGIKI